MRLTVRRIALMIALSALILAAFRSASRSLNDMKWRRLYLSIDQQDSRRAGEKSVSQLDGSRIDYRGSPLDMSNPHLTSPPQPSLLRIWSPLIASVTLSVLVVVLGFLGVDARLRMMRHQRWFWLGTVVLIWLIVPVIRIVLNPQNDYHIHQNKRKFEYTWVEGVRNYEVKGFTWSVHMTPFWPRYWRYLLGRPSPGDYVCPLDPEWSIPPPHRKKEWLIF